MRLLLSMCPTAWVLKLTTCWGIGYLKAPGTWGSVVGLVVYSVVFYSLEGWVYLALAALWVYIGVLLCGEAERRLQRKDPQCVILDEVVAMPVCFLGFKPQAASGTVWLWLLVGLGLFRFFDILKPLGIRRIERLPGGLGLVMDDVVAAVYTAVCLNGLCYVMG